MLILLARVLFASQGQPLELARQSGPQKLAPSFARPISQEVVTPLMLLFPFRLLAGLLFLLSVQLSEALFQLFQSGFSGCRDKGSERVSPGGE